MALTLAQQTSYPSWGYMLRTPRSTGTLWENWEINDKSQNHSFLGGGMAQWLLNSVAGIRPIEPGYAEIEFKPSLAVVKNLTAASASIPTVRGTAAISWTRKDAVVTLDVTMPPNSRARIYVPVLGDAATAIVREADIVLWQSKTFKSGIAGISSAFADTGCVVVEAGSGHYQFIAK